MNGYAKQLTASVFNQLTLMFKKSLYKKKYIYRFTFDTSPLKVPGFFAGYSDLQYIFINSDYHNNMH